MSFDTIDTLETLQNLSAPAKILTGNKVLEYCPKEYRQFLDLWYDKKQPQKLPEHRDISLEDMSEELPFISIFDIEWGPFRMRCKFMGSAFVKAIGYDATGRYVRDSIDGKMLQRRSKWSAVKAEPILTLSVPIVWSVNKDYQTYDALCLPFSGKDGKAKTIYYLNRFHWG